MKVKWGDLKDDKTKIVYFLVFLFSVYGVIAISRTGSKQEYDSLRTQIELVQRDNEQLKSDNQRLRDTVDELNRLNEQCLERIRRLNDLSESIDQELGGIQSSGSALGIYLREISRRIKQNTTFD